MSDIITTLHPDTDESTNLYPNIKKQNIPDKSIDMNKIDDDVKSLLDSINELHPSGVDTSTNILAFTTNKGIYIGSDTGYWYYWDGSQYVSGGDYQASEIADHSITPDKLDDDTNEKLDLIGIPFTLNAISFSSTIANAQVSNINYNGKNITYTTTGNDNFLVPNIELLPNHKYKLVFISPNVRYMTFRVYKNYVYNQTLINSRLISSGTSVLDLPNITSGGYLAITINGSISTQDLSLYLYDITNLTDYQVEKIDFTNYGDTISLNIYCLDGKVELPYLNSYYKNLHYSALGDSLTAIGSGSYYLDVIDKVLGTTHTNCGIGGTRVSGPDNTDFYSDTRVNTLSLDSDFVTIMGGTNDIFQTYYEHYPSDAFHGIGEISKTNYDVKTFVGAYNVLISKIYYKFLKLDSGYYNDIDYSNITKVSNVKQDFNIVLIVPPRRFDTNPNINVSSSIKIIADTVIEIAKMWNIPYINAFYDMGINEMNKSIYFPSSDLLHFNKLAHNQLGNLCVGKLKDIKSINSL